MRDVLCGSIVRRSFEALSAVVVVVWLAMELRTLRWVKGP
jgi:hypothetical protein